MFVNEARQLADSSIHSVYSAQRRVVLREADLSVHEGLQGDQDKHEAEEGWGRQHVQGPSPYPPVQQGMLHAVQ